MRKVLLLMLVLGAAALIACGGGDDEEPTASGTESASGSVSSSGPVDEEGAGDAETTVAATLTEFKIELDKDSAPSGEVTINAKNDGAVAHEIVVVRTDLAPDALPMADGGVVDETKVESLGEIEEFDAGSSESGTFTLAPGKFVLLCNVAGHYSAGMHTAFTVE
jgi:uncharacterized cupredoxin-like copper-binding protein